MTVVCSGWFKRKCSLWLMMLHEFFAETAVVQPNRAPSRLFSTIISHLSCGKPSPSASTNPPPTHHPPSTHQPIPPSHPPIPKAPWPHPQASPHPPKLRTSWRLWRLSCVVRPTARAGLPLRWAPASLGGWVGGWCLVGSGGFRWVEVG